MALSLTKIKKHYQRCIQSCKSFIMFDRVDVITCATDILISHPLTVIRRQCQVREDSQEYHLTPVSLLPVVVVLVQRKGFKILFKGLFSVVILHTVQFGVEKIISKWTGWPSKRPPTWYINKYLFFHFLLKFSSYIITFPIYSASVINTVSVTGDLARNHSFTFQKYNFPLSFWQTMLPTSVYRFVKYTSSQATHSISAAMQYLNYCFDKKNQLACQGSGEDIKPEEKQEIILKASVISYLSAEFVFYPLETIVHRLILQGTHTFTNDLDCGTAIVHIFSAHNGFLDCWDNVKWLEGQLGLYKGFGALIMQAILYHYCIKFLYVGCYYVKICKETYF